MMEKMENGETVIGMLHHVIIGLWYRSRECTPSWTGDDQNLTNITVDLLKTQDFLKASMTQQASTTINLKEATAKSLATTNNLTAAITKLTALNPTPNPNVQWPSLPSLHPLQPSMITSTHNPNLTTSNTRLQQHLLLSAR